MASICKVEFHLYSPVHNCRKFSAVLCLNCNSEHGWLVHIGRVTHFGTMSLNNSIFNRPAGVSPILISMNTMGLVELDDIVVIKPDSTRR